MTLTHFSLLYTQMVLTSKSDRILNRYNSGARDFQGIDLKETDLINRHRPHLRFCLGSSGFQPDFWRGLMLT
jgi:hypothetical protein